MSGASAKGWARGMTAILFSPERVESVLADMPSVAALLPGRGQEDQRHGDRDTPRKCVRTFLGHALPCSSRGWR